MCFDFLLPRLRGAAALWRFGPSILDSVQAPHAAPSPEFRSFRSPASVRRVASVDNPYRTWVSGSVYFSNHLKLNVFLALVRLLHFRWQAVNAVFK
jgi:hypothetical protein